MKAAPDDEVSIPSDGSGPRWEEDPGFGEIPLPLLEGSRVADSEAAVDSSSKHDILHLERRGVNRAVSRAANCPTLL